MTENKTTDGDPETDIFSERTQLKPYEYPDVLEYKDAIRNSYWVHTEFNFSGDVQDFKVNTTPAEKTVIKRTMLAIAQIEVQVKTFWADIYDEMPKAEVGNVGENTHYVVGVCPLGSTDYAATDAYPGKGNSYYIGDVARRLLSIAEDYVDIRMVYADREFHAVDVIQTLTDKELDYVIPAQKDRHRIGPMCDRFDQVKQGYHEPNDTPLYVEEDFVMHGTVKGGVSNHTVHTTVAVLPPAEDDDVHEEGSPQPFITSLDVSDEVALDRRWAKKQIEQYSDRGAIENSYSSIKDAAAWTTSKEFGVRWFHFAFGCVVYNMWLLVDFLTQERIGVIETRKKPRITLSRFLDWLDKELVTLL